MLNPIRLYTRSQEIQLNWIRNHPVQYVALNAVLLVVGIGAAELYSRRLNREKDELIANTEI